MPIWQHQVGCLFGICVEIVYETGSSYLFVRMIYRHLGGTKVPGRTREAGSLRLWQALADGTSHLVFRVGSLYGDLVQPSLLAVDSWKSKFVLDDQ